MCNEEFRFLTAYCFSVYFSDYPRNVRETILKERILSGTHARIEQRKRRKGLNNNRGLGYTHFRYKLGDETEKEMNICVHSFRNLFCIGKRMWQRLSKEALTLAPGPTKHGNVGLQNRHFSSLLYETEPDVVTFLKGIGQQHGESYATRFVRERSSVGLRREEVDAIDLPSHFTKRQLYKR